MPGSLEGSEEGELLLMKHLILDVCEVSFLSLFPLFQCLS